MARGLTVLKVENIKPDPSRRIEIADHGKPGLYLVVQPSGKKSWAIRYRRLRDKAPRKYTLDGFPSLGAARKLAQDVLDKVAEGADPAEQKQLDKRTIRETESDYFGDVVARFVKRSLRPSNRTWRESARVLGLREGDGDDLQIVPGGLTDRWAKRRISEITKRDVLAVLDDIVDRGSPVMANRTLAWTRRLFNWCIEKDLAAVSPCAGVKPPATETSRDRILTDDEIRKFWKACDALGFPFGPAGKVLLLTGQRKGEVTGMRLDEVKEGIWRIPASRSKNKRAHQVPLARAALDILQSVPSISGELVFSLNGRNPATGWPAAKQRLDAAMQVSDWRLHDLRRTAASGMARVGIQLPVIEKALNHTSGSFAGIVGVYQRHSFENEMRAALDAWADEVERIVSGKPADIVRLRRA
jgi:integrase